ncbi:MAG: DinB family protein [Pyrinomonadaceae bacterium]
MQVDMQKQEPTKEEMLAQYVGMPGQLDAALAGLSESDLNLSRTRDAWTIRQIVHHVVDADDMTKTIIKAALGNSGCHFELDWYDPNNAWAETMNYATRNLATAITLLRANHSHMEQLLCQLPDAWERYVMLKRQQGSEERKLAAAQLLHSQTAHALHHIEQIRATRQIHGV